MVAKFFITGTDTDVGKTVVACGLLSAAAQRGYSTAAIKPLAAGCEQTPAGLRNSDALQLQEAMTMEMTYEQVNPVAMEPPIAPHIAAQQLGKRLQVSRLAGFCQGVLMRRADFTVIEGAGGWRVPVNQVETLADLAKGLQLPVILVVGIRLGCINHALLTAQAIRADGLPLAGWVANQIDPVMDYSQENIDTLKAMMSAPCLGVVPYLQGASLTPAQVAGYLSLDSLSI